MFRISDKYSGLEKRKLIDKKRDEEYRQNFRKKNHQISRELDNYFFPKLHKRGWFPNGKYIVKQHYYYANPGLGYHYERKNVDQLKDLIKLQEEKSKQKAKQDFIDYRFISDNQYIVTIEFCSNCKEHENFTSHSAELYKNYALSLQKCILLRFPFISVLLKPIDTDIVKSDWHKIKKEDNTDKKNNTKIPMFYINDQFKEVRIGAFEVQLCLKSDNQPKVIVLHSKLETKQWPKIEVILNKIVSYMPFFKARIFVYQKDLEENEEENSQINEENMENQDMVNQVQENNENNRNNNQSGIFKGGLIDGLKINIFLQKNNQIGQISNESWEEIQSEKDPYKRKLMNKEKKLIEKQEMYKSNRSNILHSNNANRNISHIIDNKNFCRTRPPSATTTRRPNYTLNKNSRPNSSKNKISINIDNDYINNCINPMEQNLILDKKICESLKGKLIICKYTNNEGYIDIGPIPYDSYYIEVAENKQYRSVGMCLSFNKLPTKNKNFIKRYIGLYTQENAFIQLHVFENIKDGENKEDPVHISKAQVMVEVLRDENKEDYLEEKEIKFEIKEKTNSPGIFEQMVPPGKYLIKIKKENYEAVAKICYLKKGLNCINIEMLKERACKLVIKVFNFEKITNEIYFPVQNADVVLYHENEVLEQGITDSKGEFEYIVEKGEDFLTVVINKMGYYPIQRTFIRDKNMPINEQDNQYYEEMSFFLVKKSFIYEKNRVLFSIYSNIKRNNFSTDSIDFLEKNRYTINIYNAQESDGILSICMFKEEGETENTQTQNNYENNNENNNNNENIDKNDNIGTGSNFNPNQEEIEQNNNNNVMNNNNNNNAYTENNNQNTETEEKEDINNNNEGNNESNEEIKENFDYIMNLTLIINTEELLNPNYQDKGKMMNGLERYGCQTIIYTPRNTFFINSPSLAREGYQFWNLGWFDFKNILFYQTNLLLENRLERVQFLSLWIDFLQILITNQIYKNIFEYFGFEGSTLIGKDRFIYEPIFKKILTGLKFCDENENADVLQFICDLFKGNNNMISFSLIKKKISSNLKNFFDGTENESSSHPSVNANNEEEQKADENGQV